MRFGPPWRTKKADGEQRACYKTFEGHLKASDCAWRVARRNPIHCASEFTRQFFHPGEGIRRVGSSLSGAV